MKSIDAVTLRDNAASVAVAASGFSVCATLTMVAEKTLSSPIGGAGAGPKGIPGLAWLLLLRVPSRR